MVGLWSYNQSGVTDILIMRDPHYGHMCFKSVKTLGTFLAVEKATAKNVAFLGFYTILSDDGLTSNQHRVNVGCGQCYKTNNNSV